MYSARREAPPSLARPQCHLDYPEPPCAQVFLLLAEEASWEEGDAEEVAAAATQELHLEVIAIQRKYYFSS